MAASQDHEATLLRIIQTPSVDTGTHKESIKSATLPSYTMKIRYKMQLQLAKIEERIEHCMLSYINQQENCIMLLLWALCHNLPQLPLIPACVSIATASTLQIFF